MKIKELNWHDEPARRLDGKSNGSVAEDDVWPNDWHRLYIRYDVRRGATKETDDQWNILIQFPDKMIQELDVGSLEKGKIICEHYRKKFWESYYKSLMDEIYNE